MGVFTGSGKKPPVAGAGSSVDPKRPAYRDASGYSPEEKVNDGPRGGRKGKVSPFHGQNSDASGEHDDLIPQTSEQKDPYRARGSDFPVKRVAASTGQSGAGEAGFSSGGNELARYTSGQEGPRTAEDDGMGDHGSGTPVPSDRGSRVASAFPIVVSKGESNSDTGEIGIAEMVDFQTGYIVGGSSRTRVDEVPEDKVTIGSAPSRNMKAGLTKKDY